MGYYTRFELKVRIPPPVSEWDIIQELRDDNMNAENVFNEDGDSEESGKWYEHEEDMKRFSEAYPGVLFTLKGWGEENEDIWIKYFKNGKMHKAEAKVILEDFDESKLE